MINVSDNNSMTSQAQE